MKRMFFSLLTILTVLSTFAQEGQPERVSLNLSLNDAKQYAIEHNRSLQNASLSVKQAEASRWQTIATMLPQAKASVDYSNMCGYNMQIGGFSVPMNPSGTLAITASVAITGSQIVGTLLKNIAIDMSNVQAKQTEQTVSSDVTTTYYSILAMEETVVLLEKNLKNMQDIYERAQNAVNIGTSEQTTADQISVQLASYQSSINSTKRQVETLYNMLRIYLGAGVDCDIILTEKLEDLLNIDTTIDLLSSELILDNNYDYQLVSKNTELAKKQITLTAMDYVPSLSGYYQYSAKTYFGAAEGMNTTPPNMIGVSLGIPIWSSGKRASAVTEKKLAYAAAQNTLADTEDLLKVQDKQLKYNLKSAYETYEVQKKNINVTQSVFENVSKKFEFGYASSTEVTTATQELLTAQTNYISSMLEMVNAYINLKNLLNK